MYTHTLHSSQTWKQQDGGPGSIHRNFLWAACNAFNMRLGGNLKTLLSSLSGPELFSYAAIPTFGCRVDGRVDSRALIGLNNMPDIIELACASGF